MALAQVFDWAMNKVRFYFACLSYVKGFTLNCMFEIISSLRLSELQELIEDIYYISPFYGWENWDQERTRGMSHGISLCLSLSAFFFLIHVLLKCDFGKGSFWLETSAIPYPSLEQKTEILVMRLRFPNCQYHWTGHIKRKPGLNVNILEKEMTLKIHCDSK